ncbi:MAG TPA: hypothetical protein VG267_03850 [Terracidiphilus sp.]|jgi:hypothetical protein|nr:hypothetical protein [Terracidiphilus sp.]
MRCNACGAELAGDDLKCGRCGRPATTPALPPAAAAGERDRFAREIGRLSLFYALFAGVNIVLGGIGLFLARTGWMAASGPWEPWPHLPLMAVTYQGASAWALLVIRTGMALVAWDSLQARRPGGRRAAIVAGALAFTQFPIGLMLGAYTLVSLMGKRGARLYTRLLKA